MGNLGVATLLFLAQLSYGHGHISSAGEVGGGECTPGFGETRRAGRFDAAAGGRRVDAVTEIRRKDDGDGNENKHNDNENKHDIYKANGNENKHDIYKANDKNKEKGASRSGADTNDAGGMFPCMWGHWGDWGRGYNTLALKEEGMLTRMQDLAMQRLAATHATPDDLRSEGIRYARNSNHELAVAAFLASHLKGGPCLDDLAVALMNWGASFEPIPSQGLLRASAQTWWIAMGSFVPESDPLYQQNVARLLAWVQHYHPDMYAARASKWEQLRRHWSTESRGHQETYPDRLEGDAKRTAEPEKRQREASDEKALAGRERAAQQAHEKVDVSPQSTGDRHTASQDVRGAYVAFMFNERDIRGLLALNYQVKQLYASPFPFHALVVKGNVSDEAIRVMEGDGIKVEWVDFEVEMEKNGIQLEELRFHFQTRAPQLTGRQGYPYQIMAKGLVMGVGAGEYDSMLYLDSDLMLHESIDELIMGHGLTHERKKSGLPRDGEIYMVTDTLLKQASEPGLLFHIRIDERIFNTGLMLYKPSQMLVRSYWQEIRNLMDKKRGKESHWCTSDQDVTNSMVHYGVVGAVRLAHDYNVYANLADPLVRQGVVGRERVTHFIGAKPMTTWSSLEPGESSADTPGQISRVLQWYQIYSQYSVARQFKRVMINSYHIYATMPQTFIPMTNDEKVARLGSHDGDHAPDHFRHDTKDPDTGASDDPSIARMQRLVVASLPKVRHGYA